MTVDEAQIKISSTGFLDWKAFLDYEFHERKPEHYYFAQLTQAVKQVLAKKPKRIKLEHYLLRFKDSNSRRKAANDGEFRMQQSKNFWFAITGVPRKPPPQKG